MHIFEYVCGRFDNLIARDAYRGLFKAQRLPKSNFPLRYNVAPTDQIPIVRIDPRDGEREVVMARWGLIPLWMKEKPNVPHINARAETVKFAGLWEFARLGGEEILSTAMIVGEANPLVGGVHDPYARHADAGGL